MRYARQSNVKNLRRQNFSSCFFVREDKIFYICHIKSIDRLAMNRKLKLALAALLGFSAACSTVKKVPSKGAHDTEVPADSISIVHPIVVMYGVRPPVEKVEHRSLDSLLQPDSTATTTSEANKTDE